MSLRPASRALLDAARGGDDPTPESRAAVKAGVARHVAMVGAAALVARTASASTRASVSTSASLGGSLGAQTATGAALGAKVSMVVAVAKVAGAATLVAGLAGGGVAVVAARGHRAHPSPERTAVAAVQSTTPSAPRMPVVQSPPSPAAETSTGEVPCAQGLPEQPPIAAVATTVRPRAANPAVPRSEGSIQAAADAPIAREAPIATEASAGTLVEETRLLREAGVALREGRAFAALAALREHASRFPNGLLSEECAAEKVLVLCELGRVEEARAGAAVFLRDRPRSPLAERVRLSCAGDSQTKVP